MKKFLSTFLLGSTLVLAACGGGGDDAADSGDDSASLDDSHPGAEIAKQNCASCHGQDFSGASGPQLAGTSLSEDEFADIVKNGKDQMPPFESLSDDEVKDIYDYLHSN